MELFAVLGSHPELSLAELKSVTNSSPKEASSTVAVFESSENPVELQKRLGGSQKIGTVVEHAVTDDKEQLSELIAKLLAEKSPGSKLLFGLSVYDLSNHKQYVKLQDNRLRLGLQIKKALKGLGMSSRFVTSKQATLSAADILHNQLLRRGAEVVLIAREKSLYIGITAGVQDINDWSHRDMGRPWRNAKRGMLPPKLARMMVNLAGADTSGKILLDPFCGSGTVLMEAGLIGYRTIGGDKSEEAIEDTQRNLDWINQQGYGISMPELFTSTAANLHAHLKPNSIDAIVTEPFLGTPRQGTESHDRLLQMTRELEDLYRESFSRLQGLLKPGGSLVIALPVHHRENTAYEPQVSSALEKTGYKEVLFTKPLYYRQSDQFVGRHLVKFIV